MPPPKNIEKAKRFSLRCFNLVRIVKETKDGFMSTLKLPEQYETLAAGKEALDSKCSQQAAKITQLKNANDALTRDKDNLARQLKEENQKLQNLLKKNQEATANNPLNAGGDSKTTYVQWIKHYIQLLQDYDDKVCDVIDNTPENIADIRSVVVEILRNGLADSTNSNLASPIENIDKVLRPEYRNSALAEYRDFYQFFADMAELASKAEQYKKNFYIFVPPVGSEFGNNYARTRQGVHTKKQDVKGQKITQCYLPAVFFFFTYDNLAACAPALVDVEA